MPIKIPQQEDTLYVIKSFDDVIDNEARNNLRDIDAGKKEFVAGTTATGFINNAENLGEKDVPAGTTATGSINNEENLGEVEVHEVTNSVAHETKSDSESEYIEIKISIRKK